MISYIIFSLLVIWVIIWLSHALSQPVIESFWGQIEDQAPAPISLDFRSPKSNIMNFNETTQLHQELNTVKASNAHVVDPYVPLPEWVYPFTYVNRKFDHILTTLVHKIEKDHNHNERLHDRPNEWRNAYPYLTQSWSQLTPIIKRLIKSVIDEINRRFNMEVPIVGYHHHEIKYHWINNTEIIIVINVYKRYTIDDIKYPVEIDPNINEHLKSNFERELVIYIDDLEPENPGEPLQFHIKYLRFPAIDYQTEDVWDDLMYVKEKDNSFYLAKSKDPMYRMLSNTEARDGYIEYITRSREKAKYKCFPPKLKANLSVSQIKDQTLCEQANALWEKQCEKDSECPYYQSNKNYPNKFGGCNQKTGYCQMPTNVKPLTYHKPTNPQEAYCYNCQQGFLGDLSIGQCCQEQDPNPDYMFDNDIKQRRKSAEILRQKGLNWTRYLD